MPGLAGRHVRGMAESRTVAIPWPRPGPWRWPGEVGVGRGVTRYQGGDRRPEREYANLFLLRFDERGRCREYVEWWVKRPPRSSGTQGRHPSPAPPHGGGDYVQLGRFWIAQ